MTILIFLAAAVVGTVLYVKLDDVFDRMQDEWDQHRWSL